MLAQFNFNFNSEFIKYLVIALTIPFWLPFVKALLEDFNDALRDEGGLLGYAPPRSKLEEMNRDLGRYDSVLVSEPWERIGARASTGPQTPSARGASAAPQKRTPGFRRDDRPAAPPRGGAQKRAGGPAGGVAGAPLRPRGSDRRRLH